MKVFCDGPHPALSLVHEVGHVLDFRVMCNRSPAMTQAKKRLLDALKASDEYKALQTKLQKLKSAKSLSKRLHDSADHLQYLMSDNELIARSYAQFIAQRQKSGLVLEEFKNDVILNHDNYFQSCSGAVAGCFNEILKLTVAK